MNPNEVVKSGDLIKRVAHYSPKEAGQMLNHLAWQVIGAIADGTARNGKLCAKLTHEICEELMKHEEML